MKIYRISRNSVGFHCSGLSKYGVKWQTLLTFLGGKCLKRYFRINGHIFCKDVICCVCPPT
uniref:Uncharacterized protein n=1 Tax=Anguilla anguilla TaxID=7936 RepID=A0A0E9RDU1_ANGAN